MQGEDSVCDAPGPQADAEVSKPVCGSMLLVRLLKRGIGSGPLYVAG